MTKYDIPIVSLEHALACLDEAERRYSGKVVLDSDFPVIEDAAGLCHTDAVLRAIGAKYGQILAGHLCDFR